MKMKKISSVLVALTLGCSMFTGCNNGDYGKYAAAYNKVTANGGMEADIALTLTMDGTTTKSNGTLKLDTSSGKSILYYEMDVDGDKVIQFSDGDYIYTDTDGHKIKYAINSKPSASGDREETQQKDAGASGDSDFNTEAFLSEFSSVLEAGKIKDLGLLSPIDNAAITNISVSGDQYTLTFSDSLVKKYLNILISNESNSSSGETLVIDELQNFTNVVTVSGDIVTGAKYSGVLKVKVPGSLMASGQEATYDMDLIIDVTFVNPGSSVSITLPSTDGYENV